MKKKLYFSYRKVGNCEYLIYLEKPIDTLSKYELVLKSKRNKKPRKKVEVLR